MIELTPVVCVQKSTRQASTKGTTYLRRNSGSWTFLPVELTVEAFCARVSISCNSMAACWGVRERNRAARACSFLPRLKSQRGDSETIKLHRKNRMPGGRATQKRLRHA